MGTRLYWIPERRDGVALDQLKFPLEKRFGLIGSDGIVLSEDHSEWLRGVADANEHCAKEVDAVIEALSIHGRIRVYARI